VPPPALYAPASLDRFGERRGLGVSVVEFKVTPQGGAGALLMLENVCHAKGGPARHLRYDQNEVFYALEGEFLIEVVDERMRLPPATHGSRHGVSRTFGRMSARDVGVS
jgi:hypothetical protein